MHKCVVELLLYATVASLAIFHAIFWHVGIPCAPLSTSQIISRDPSTRTYFTESTTKYAASREGVKRTTVQGPSRGNGYNEDPVNPGPNDPEGDGCACCPIEGSRTGELCQTCAGRCQVYRHISTRVVQYTLPSLSGHGMRNTVMETTKLLLRSLT